MNSLVETLAGRGVGIVESVAADRISILVDPDAPHATALNTGIPAGFPRINGYLLVPNESGATFGIISSVRIERLPYPKRRGMKDFGLVDLPFPARILHLTPLGTLAAKETDADGDIGFQVRRGVDVFPSVGDTVVLPTERQLQAIVEGEDSRSRGRIMLGTSPTAGGAPVYADPDKLFGRHLAVLGNTGAGKSCSVAGLIRWSLDAAKEARGDETPNARFIVLDPNGEYAKAFKDLEPRVFQVDGKDPVRPLRAPAWMWNGEEWAAFTDAAPGVQRPILFDALRRLKSGAGSQNLTESTLRGRVKRYGTALRLRIQDGDHLVKGRREGVADLLINLAGDFQELIGATTNTIDHRLQELVGLVSEIEERARGQRRGDQFWHGDFREGDLQEVIDKLQDIANAIGLSDEIALTSEDAPVYFPVGELSGFVEAIASTTSSRDVSGFIDSLNLRINGLLKGDAISSVAQPETPDDASLEHWLAEYIGNDGARNGAVAVIDLSLVPSESVNVVVAVLGRIVFEAIQRHRRTAESELPTVLVLEEAHSFVHRAMSSEAASAAARVCSRTFERIAREGRKFGLGLVLSSQRPSEISETVLSQCNTFLLHRVVNDRDQSLVRKLIPDGLADLLRELPSLPSRRAILLGWGAPAPLLLEMRELPKRHQPHSPDPEFWKAWTGEKECKIDWAAVAREWVSKSPGEAPSYD